MTPRERPAGDLAKLMQLMGGVAADLSEMKDHVVRSDARSDEVVKRLSKVEAQFETMTAEIAAVEQRRANTSAELLATQRNSYREFTTQLGTMQDKIDRHDAEALRNATEGAAQGAATGAVAQVNVRGWKLAAWAAGGVSAALAAAKGLAWAIGLVFAAAKVHVLGGDG